jgi:hypothetical protein
MISEGHNKVIKAICYKGSMDKRTAFDEAVQRMFEV